MTSRPRRSALAALRDSITELMRFLMLAIALEAISIIFLTFETWVRFQNDTHISGLDADAVFGFGDGYIVVALAVAALVVTGISLISPRFVSETMAIVGIASIGILLITGYDATTSWHVSGQSPSGVIFVEGGSVTSAVYSIGVLGVVMGIVAALVVGLRYWETAKERAAAGPDATD
jgi:hypothetical protein